MNKDIWDKISKIIQSQPTIQSKGEAQTILRGCGILDEHNCVVPEYKKFITEMFKYCEDLVDET